MATFFQKIEGNDYISNFYRYKLFDKKTKNYILTTDDGNFLFLNHSAFRQLKKGKIEDKKLYDALLLKGIIITDKNFNDIVEKFKTRYSFLENGTSLHIVIPTFRCNLACTYCFASSCKIDAPKDENDMNEDMAVKITEFIMKSPSNAITIEFQGGEPLVRFDIIQIIVKEAQKLNKIYKKDLRFALVSNFTLMSEEIANWLIDNKVTFCTSLDGPKEVHNKNRFILAKDDIEIGTYESVSFWINKINQIYKDKQIEGNVNALMTITKNSLPFYKEIIDTYSEHGIYMVNIRGLTQVGRVFDNEDSISYPHSEFLKFYEKSINYILELNDNDIPMLERIKQLFIEKIYQNTPTYHTEYESPCGAATGQITYFRDGSIYTCNEALGREEFKLGNVIENSWQEIFKKKETAKAILNSMIENNVKCDRCIYKPYCSTCMVENYYNQKKFNFYPDKTLKHHETIYHSNKIFNSILDEIKKTL